LAGALRVVFFAVDFLAGALRVVFRAAVFFAVDLFAVDFRTVLLRAGAFFAAAFRAGALRVVFRAVVFFAVDLFAVDFRAVLFFAVARFAGDFAAALRVAFFTGGTSHHLPFVSDGNAARRPGRSPSGRITGAVVASRVQRRLLQSNCACAHLTRSATAPIAPRHAIALQRARQAFLARDLRARLVRDARDDE
jgi:hypothetical protein